MEASGSDEQSCTGSGLKFSSVVVGSSLKPLWAAIESGIHYKYFKNHLTGSCQGMANIAKAG